MTSKMLENQILFLSSAEVTDIQFTLWYFRFNICSGRIKLLSTEIDQR